MHDGQERYRHIVVAFDGSDESWTALKEAVRIARSSQARLDLLVAIPDDTPAGAREAFEEALERASSQAVDLPVMRYVIEGDPGSVIVEHADARQCDLIVMGCRSQIDPNDKLGESVTTAVSQRARMPVLVVRDDGRIAEGKAPITLGPVVLCYDGSDGARRAIERTGALLPGAEAIVLHLWDSPGVGAYAPPAHVGPAMHAHAVSIAAEGAELARHAGLQARPLPAGLGVSWESILAVAAEQHASLIVTGARGMTGARAMLGSISNGVAHHSRIPVLLVPPPGADDTRSHEQHDPAASSEPAVSGTERLVHAMAGLTRSQRADALARYVILEAGRGRNLTDILDDAYIANRGDRATLHALLDRHDVVEALGHEATAGLRAQIAALG